MPHLLFPGQFFDNSGVVVAGGSLNFYEGSTTTPDATVAYPTYDDAVAGTSALGAVATLDSAGYKQVWLLDRATKVVLENAAGTVLRTWDDIYGAGAGQVIAVDSGNDVDITILNDNDANALTIKEGSNNYINFDTTNTAEKIIIGNSTQKQLLQNEGALALPSQTTIGDGYIDAATARATPTSLKGKFFLTIEPSGTSNDYFALSDKVDGQLIFIVNLSATINAYVDNDEVVGIYCEPASTKLAYWNATAFTWYYVS